jgi:MFS family permease
MRTVRHRFQLMLALRFIPTGLFITVFVLLMQERGLSLGQIGLATAAQGAVMLFLELPSGGLADALGRKPVLLLAVGFSVLASGVLLVADSVVLLALVSVLNGVFRALDSGPLEAWFIDASLAADPSVDIERGLSRQNIVICSAIGVGALMGGGVVAVTSSLSMPIAIGLAVQLLELIAVASLMDEVRKGQGWAAARARVREVPNVVRDAMRIIRLSSLLKALIVGELLWGFGMIAFEVLLPPRLAEVSGGADEAATLLGPSVTAAWVLSALGAAAAPWLVRRFGSGPAGCVLRIAHGLTVVGMGLAAGPVGLIVAYLATYWVHGASAPVHYGMVHRAVSGSHRATVVSANSLASQVGGALSGIALGALADATSISTAMLVAAAVLAAAAPLYLVGQSPPLDDRRGGASRGPLPS